MNHDALFDDRARVEPNTGCWLWTGWVIRSGYGAIAAHDDEPGPRIILAHRYAYERFVGPIPEGRELDHLCRQRCCCNPDHLEAVTHAENMRRASGHGVGKYWATQTHCKNGHEFTPENTGTRRDHPGRYCRTCGRMRERERKLAKKEQR